MHGVGYRAQLQGTKLVLSVGKSHQDEVEAPEGITFEVPSATSIVVSGINKKLLVKQQLTSVAFVLQNLTKVKVSVTLVNTYVVKKVKLVNNRILSLWLFFWISHLPKALMSNHYN